MQINLTDTEAEQVKADLALLVRFLDDDHDCANALLSPARTAAARMAALLAPTEA